MSNRRKRMGGFCVEVFSQGMKEHQTEKYPRMVKIISTGNEGTLTTSRFPNLRTLFFEKHRNLHKLGASVS